jgi:hypothetical protein
LIHELKLSQRTNIFDYLSIFEWKSALRITGEGDAGSLLKTGAAFAASSGVESQCLAGYVGYTVMDRHRMKMGRLSYAPPVSASS